MKKDPLNKRKDGKPKRRFKDAVRDNMKMVGSIEDDAMNREG